MNYKRLLQNRWIRLGKQSISGWMEDEAPSKGAATAYYAMFSMAPLLFLIISIAGLFFGAEAVRGVVFAQVADLMGENGAQAIEEMLANVSEPKTGIWATLISLAVLVFGATTVFAQLQAALDAIWEVPAELAKAEKRNAIWAFVKGRLLSFGLVLALAFLIVVSLVLSAAMSALGKWWGPAFGEWETVAHLFNLAVGFGMLTVVFAAIYKFMPRAAIEWRDVWVGAAVTAALFVIGKFLIGLYLGKSDVGSSFGAFGSIIIVMVWVYYSAQIFLLGAEFTWVYAHDAGSRQAQPAARENLVREAVEPQRKPLPATSAVVASQPLMPIAPAIERRRRWDSRNAMVRALQRKGVFGVTVAAAFLGGAVLRKVIAER
jgi:membrane protein